MWATLVLSGVAGCGNPAAVEWGIVGDSLTGTLVTPTYPALLVTALELPPAALVADGRGGRPARDGPAAVEALVEAYPNLHTLIFFLGGADIVDFVADADPDLVRDLDDPADGISVELAEVLEDIGGAVDAALDRAVAARLAVWVVTYPPVPAPELPCVAFGRRLGPEEAARARRYVGRLNDTLRAAAERAGAGLIDLEVLDPLGTDPRYFADCLHPSADGAARLAGTMATALR